MYLLILCICILIIIIPGCACVLLKKRNLYEKNKIVYKDGIDEEVILDIGGIKQYLYIRGEDKNKPVILFLHGGPGTSMVSVLHVYQYYWERDYVVVNYDQRSANMSYYLNKDNWNDICKTINSETLINDTNEVIDYLLKRFNREKIILMSHSWGSFLGMKLAKTYPEKISTFIGIGQVLNYRKSLNKVALHVQEKIEQGHNAKDRQEIQKIIDKLNGSEELQLDMIEKIIKLQQKYLEQIKHNEFLLMILQGIISPYMKLKYLAYYFKGGKFNKPLYKDVFNCDAYKYGREYKMPVILVSGEFDYISSSDSKEFLDYIDSPYKDNIFISKSGHMCMMSNPYEFYEKINRSLKNI